MEGALKKTYDAMAEHKAKNEALIQAGVVMMDPNAVYVDAQVQVGQGTVLLPGTILRGSTVVGEGCTIGPNVMLTDTTVEDGVIINTAQVEESVIRTGCEIGPYTHIRPHCDVGEGSKIGAFVQLKNCNLGKGTKMAHLTYVGDADVGERVNFGCGTVTWQTVCIPPQAPPLPMMWRPMRWSLPVPARPSSPAGPPSTARKKSKSDLCGQPQRIKRKSGRKLNYDRTRQGH